MNDHSTTILFSISKVFNAIASPADRPAIVDLRSCFNGQALDTVTPRITKILMAKRPVEVVVFTDPTRKRKGSKTGLGFLVNISVLYIFQLNVSVEQSEQHSRRKKA